MGDISETSQIGICSYARVWWKVFSQIGICSYGL